MNRVCFFIFLLTCSFVSVSSQYNANKEVTYPYQNSSLTFQERAKDLVGRLTLEEKISLMMDASPAIERLGIPKYNWWNEALHGVGRAGIATVLPQSIGMAATFDPDAVEKAFAMVSDEARAKFNQFSANGEYDRYKGLTFWTPNVNIFRDPRWGRGQETYGEDPYLTSVMGVAVVKGLQGDSITKHIKTLAGAKHFAVHSGPEWNRHSFDAHDLYDGDLWGTYLPAFEALVKAGVGQVMCAYNRFDGEPCCGNSRLLTQILRNEWGYDGIVVTDCWALNDFFTPGAHEVYPDAVNTGAAAMISGTDLECGPVFTNLKEAVESGLISEQKIDESLTRLLTARFALGELDMGEENEWTHLPYSIVDSDAHKEIALDMARKSMTLLKNNGVLPLAKDNKSIIVMGPNATDSVMQWGNYNGIPSHTVTILEGINDKLGNVAYAQGCSHILNENLISTFDKLTHANGVPGLSAIYWNGSPEDNEPAAFTVYATPLNLNTGGATVFAPNVNLENFSGVFKGTFTPDEDGEYVIKMYSDGNGSQSAKINGEMVIVNYEERQFHDNFYVFEAKAGQPYELELEYIHRNGPAHLKFDIGKSAKFDANLDHYETVVFVGGISPAFEGEEMPVSLPGFRGGDRESIELPKIQRDFLKELKNRGKKIVFVNCSGSAIALTPEDSICDAILQAWYPGQAGGTAVSDVLFGDYNPAGRLPVTFYKNDFQLPDFENYDMEGRTYRYMDEKPLYPFGYGLSYSDFTYSEPTLQSYASINDTIPFKIPISNNSDRAGEEVVQLYVKKTDDYSGPRKTLRGFRRVMVPAGECIEVEFDLTPETFATFDKETGRMKTLPGDYKIFYGGNSETEDFAAITLVP